jgi:hypothetical protein
MVKRILIIFGFWVLGLFTLMIISTPDAKTAPIVETIFVSKLQVVQATERITHRDTIWLPTNMLCPQWAQMAIDVGWLETDLQKIDAVMHRESRCFGNSHYAEDPHGGSYGLMQINAFWCKPSRWYPNGYLQSFGVLTNCKQLFHPRTNLIAARVIWQYSHTQYGDGWLPWQP